MKKIIIGLILATLIISFAYGLSFSTTTRLGYEVIENDTITPITLSDCVDATEEDPIVLSIQGADEQLLNYDNYTLGEMRFKQSPETFEICWYLTINITEKTRTVVYTNQTLFDSFNNLRLKKIGNTWRDASEKCYRCEPEDVIRCDCVSVSKSRCYLNEDKSLWDTCRKGAVWGDWKI